MRLANVTASCPLAHSYGVEAHIGKYYFRNWTLRGGERRSPPRSVQFRVFFLFLWPNGVVASHHPFVAGQLRQAHRPAGVEALGADGHLGAQAQLRAVGETRAGV